VIVDEIADGLDASPSGRRIAEEIPRHLGQPIGLAISAAQQEYQGFLGQVLHRDLLGRGSDHIRLACIVDNRTG
jgi:hypothetical protein